VINKAQHSPRLESKNPSTDPAPRAPKNPIAKPKRTKSQSASSSKGGSQQSIASRSRKPSAPHPLSETPDPEEPIRPVVKPVRRNSKKAKEQQVEFAKVQQSPKAAPRVAQNILLQRSESKDEEYHAFQPLPQSAFAPPSDSLPIDDSVFKLIAARLPQLSGVSILKEVPAPRKNPRKTSEDGSKGSTVDLSLLPASAIKVPQEFFVQKEEQPSAREVVPEPKPETPVEESKPEEKEQQPVEESKALSPEPVQDKVVVVPEEELAPRKEDKSAEEDLSEAAEEEAEEKSESSPVPPPPPKTKKDSKAGYFHTAPARPNRHRASVKKRAPLPPIQSKQEEEPRKAESSESSQVNILHFLAWHWLNKFRKI
jgi:hypothetical protein